MSDRQNIRRTTQKRRPIAGRHEQASNKKLQRLTPIYRPTGRPTKFCRADLSVRFVGQQIGHCEQRVSLYCTKPNRKIKDRTIENKNAKHDKQRHNLLIKYNSVFPREREREREQSPSRDSCGPYRAALISKRKQNAVI